MRIAFFVNSIDGEKAHYTTAALAVAAMARGHDVCYVTPGDFVLRPDDSLMVRATVAPSKKYRKTDAFDAALKSDDATVETMEICEIDVIFLRNDPSLDADERPWA